MENVKIDSRDVRIALISGAAIIGVGILLATLLAASTWRAVRTADNALAVTGSTKEKVTSDSVKWSLGVTRHATEAGLIAANASMRADISAVNDWLSANGVSSSSITVSPVSVNENYSYNKSPGEPREYVLSSVFIITSNDVAGITALAKDTDPLVAKGIFVNTQNLEYTYSKLADLRVKLLGAAMKDARARAEEIAQADGKHVGALKSASSGVVQVLPVNSVDVSDYGAYDTQDIDKEVFVTVHASFVLQ